MKIEIKVTPNAKKTLIKQEEGLYKIYLQAPAVDGKANKALVKALGEYFGVKERQIEITKGLKSRRKTITIKGI